MKTSHTQLIIQDQKAKSIDKLSAIGGTMGLLTGFSLINIGEFLFLIIKIIKNCEVDPHLHTFPVHATGAQWPQVGLFCMFLFCDFQKIIRYNHHNP